MNAGAGRCGRSMGIATRSPTPEGLLERWKQKAGGVRINDNEVKPTIR